MGNQKRGEAYAATRPRPAEAPSDSAAEQALDQHIEEVLDYHLSGGTPVTAGATFTSGSGQVVASGNLMPRLRSTPAPELPADQPASAAATPPRPPSPCGARDRD